MRYFNSFILLAVCVAVACSLVSFVDARVNAEAITATAAKNAQRNGSPTHDNLADDGIAEHQSQSSAVDDEKARTSDGGVKREEEKKEQAEITQEPKEGKASAGTTGGGDEDIENWDLWALVLTLLGASGLAYLFIGCNSEHEAEIEAYIPPRKPTKTIRPILREGEPLLSLSVPRLSASLHSLSTVFCPRRPIYVCLLIVDLLLIFPSNGWGACACA